MVHSPAPHPLSAARKRLGSRWASRTSNPASGSRQVGGGFDSHTLPPSRFVVRARRIRRLDRKKVNNVNPIRPARSGRGRLVVTGLTVAVVAAALVGYWAYRAAADLPGVKLAD